MKRSCCVVVFLLITSSIFAQIPSGSLFHLSAEVGIIDSAGKASEWHDATNPLIKFVARILQTGHRLRAL
jgi:hypothetical protein